VTNSRQLLRLWTEDNGSLSFEWTLLVSLVVIGLVGGLAATRDAVIDELGDVAQAMLALDHSYELDSPLELLVDIDGAGGPQPPVEVGTATGSAFLDAQNFSDGGRSPATPQNQPGQLDSDS
jgi:Flp pilus assembly pilin Flp